MTLFSVFEYLCLALTAHYGDADKKDWSERLQIARDLLDGKLFRDGLDPEGQAIFEDIKSETFSKSAELDATCSGFQILTAIFCDIRGMMLCNVISEAEARRIDFYTVAFNAMKQVLRGAIGKVARDDMKNASFQSLYGSMSAVRRYLGDDPKIQGAFDAVMNNFAPKGWAMLQALNKAWDCNREYTDWYLPDGFKAFVPAEGYKTIVLPNGQRMAYQEDFTKMKYYCGLSPNFIHSVDGWFNREIIRTVNVDYDKVERALWCLDNPKEGTDKYCSTVKTMIESGIISLALIDVLTPYSVKILSDKQKAELRSILTHLPPKHDDHVFIYSVHDCFHVDPRYMTVVRRTYLRCLRQLMVHGRKLFRLFVERNCPDLLPKLTVVEKYTTTEDIRKALTLSKNADYFIC